MRNLAGNFALLLRGQNCARNSKISEVEVYSIMISTFMQLNDNDIRVSIELTVKLGEQACWWTCGRTFGRKSAKNGLGLGQKI